MIYANKKISSTANLAQQTAQVITTVKALVDKNLIRLTNDTVYLNPQLWKDKKSAENWIDCLGIYYRIKMQWKHGTLCFKHLETEELIGTLINKKAKVLLYS